MDAEVDVLIAGAGAAGMTAALVCALRASMSCSARSRRRSAAPPRPPPARSGCRAPRRRAKPASTTTSPRRGAISTRSSARPPTAAARPISTTGPELVDYLARNSEVKFSLYAKHPDYLSNRPGTTLAGRALAPLPFDGRLLGADFALLRPPIGEFMALGGMMIGRDDIEPLARPFASVANFRRVLSLLWRHATDRLRHRARHAAADGQCARGAAVLQPAPAQGAGLARTPRCAN